MSTMSEPRDPRYSHFQFSMMKSVLRFVGYAYLPLSVSVGAIILALAEALGVLEEL